MVSLLHRATITRLVVKCFLRTINQEQDTGTWISKARRKLRHLRRD